jgi:hypothetical protein
MTLADQFPGRGESSEFGFRQGRVLEWDGFTGENVIEVSGSLLTNVPLFGSLEVIGVRVGDVLFLFRTRSGYAILGRVATPGTPSPTQNTALIRDFSGNIIFAPDVISEQGIGKPYLGIPMHNAAFGAPATTTSATFEALFRGYAFKQHPKLRMRFTANNPAGVTGEARLTVDGSQVGSTVSLPASTLANYVIGPEEIAGAYEQEVIVELQVRRTAGASAIGVWMNGVTAEQS